jgi:hypothetical protein
MSKLKFPYIALFLGAMFWGMLLLGGQTGPDSRTHLPLLTLLLISEFAFILTLVGGGVMLKTMASDGFRIYRLIVCSLCFLLSLEFIRLGFYFWPE